MDDKQIFEKIRDLAAESFGIPVEEILMDSSYRDLEMDSLDAYELLLAIEETFGIDLPVDDIESISTMKDMVDLVSGRI